MIPRMRKALVAAVVAGAGAVTAAASTGTLDTGQWITAVLVAVAAGAATWSVRNAPASAPKGTMSGDV